MECYIIKEAVEFCFKYIATTKIIGIPKSRYFQDDENRSISSGEPTCLGDMGLELAHKNVLQNLS